MALQLRRHLPAIFDGHVYVEEYKVRMTCEARLERVGRARFEPHGELVQLETGLQHLANRLFIIHNENSWFLLCHCFAPFLRSPETTVKPGQRQPEGAAFANLAFDTDAAAVGFDGQFAEG